VDYYDFLQISHNADRDTIHRVYRFLGARYHPDNPVSGSTEMFSKLKTAYDVLSNPARRAEYDALCKKATRQTAPLSDSIDFMDDLEGEKNRRLGLLAVLYARRRINQFAPEVSLGEIESRMGFPRDYLDFTIWYLQKKEYITRADNGDLALTVDGVDFVETERVSVTALNKLLTDGMDSSISDSMWTTEESNPAPVPDVALSDMGPPIERRANTRDRRAGAPDRRINPVERRAGSPDRRANPTDRRGVTTDRRSNTTDRRIKG